MATNGYFPRTNEQELTFSLIDGTRHWLSIQTSFLKNIRVKGRQCPDYKSEVDSEIEAKFRSEVELKVEPDVKLDIKSDINLGVDAVVKVKM